MAGGFIDIPAADGGAFRGYLAPPPGGTGPGLMILHGIFGVNRGIRAICDYFAEEGYVALAPDMFWRIAPGIALDDEDADLAKARDYGAQLVIPTAIEDMQAVVAHMRAMDTVAGHGLGGKTQIAALGYGLGGRLAYLAAAHCGLAAAACFFGVGIEEELGFRDRISCPVVMHFGGADERVPASAVTAIRAAFQDRDSVLVCVYEDAPHGFTDRFRAGYTKAAAGMAHSRTIALLRAAMGPIYDLEALWDQHVNFEFVMRDVDATMETMVAEPYVNHVPTMTGGVGYADLHRFYKNHFINSNPDDTRMIPISRTVGADRVVDEMLFCFTHDREIDWMLPGVAPTGKRVEIPLVGIVNFRGDKLYHEHIYWDQASVLVQIGLLDPKGLPVAGVETARKVMDETLPSNELMPNWAKNGSGDHGQRDPDS